MVSIRWFSPIGLGLVLAYGWFFSLISPAEEPWEEKNAREVAISSAKNIRLCGDSMRARFGQGRYPVHSVRILSSFESDVLLYLDSLSSVSCMASSTGKISSFRPYRRTPAQQLTVDSITSRLREFHRADSSSRQHR